MSQADRRRAKILTARTIAALSVWTIAAQGPGKWANVGQSFSVRIPDGWQDISRTRGAAPNEAFLAFVPPGDALTKGPMVSPHGALIVASDDGVSDDIEAGIRRDIDRHRGIDLDEKRETLPGNSLIKDLQTVRWRDPMTQAFVYENVEEYFAVDGHVLSIGVMYRLGNPRTAQFEKALRDVLLSIRRRIR